MYTLIKKSGFAPLMKLETYIHINPKFIYTHYNYMNSSMLPLIPNMIAKMSLSVLLVDET
jgi:hypothetical protein